MKTPATWRKRCFSFRSIPTIWRKHCFSPRTIPATWRKHSFSPRTLPATWRKRHFPSRSLSAAWRKHSRPSSCFSATWRKFHTGGGRSPLSLLVGFMLICCLRYVSEKEAMSTLGINNTPFGLSITSARHRRNRQCPRLRGVSWQPSFCRARFFDCLVQWCVPKNCWPFFQKSSITIAKVTKKLSFSAFRPEKNGQIHHSNVILAVLGSEIKE